MGTNNRLFFIRLYSLLFFQILQRNINDVMSSNFVNHDTSILGSGPFTLFAPTNEAFSKLPPGTLDHLLQNVTALTDVLTYHIVSGTFYSAGLEDNMTPNTIEGKPITIRLGSGNTYTLDLKDI